MERFAATAAAALSQVLGREISGSELDVPPDPAMGDFALPCFKFSKELRQAPPQIASELAGRVKAEAGAILARDGLLVSAAGPYVNFTVPGDRAVSAILADVLAGDVDDLGSYGSRPPRSRGRWCIEYSAPNIAKPFMIAHLRSTALGAALARVGLYRGVDVVRLNHLGDWGTQYGKLSVAYRMFERELPPEPKIDDLVRIYVKFHDEVEKRPELEDEAREAFKKLEDGDPALTALWKKCVEISLKEFSRTYKRLGVEFDHNWGESHYRELLAPLLERLRREGLLVESEGAWVVPLTDESGKDLPPCILQKKDGATIYATRDVAAAIYRQEKFHFERMLYVVGGEQKLHFQQVFGVLKKMGYAWASKCEHVPYGLYRFKGGKMSTRKGNFVTLEEILEEVRGKVAHVIRERRTSPAATTAAAAATELIGAGDVEAITEAVAIGALVFHDLGSDPVRDVEFDVDRVVDFEGETGPYLQYAHTRCVSVLRKARESGELKAARPAFDASATRALVRPEEIRLLKTLGQFPHHLERVITFSKASQLCHYLIDVTKVFGAFYRECRVLGEAPELTAARLMLVEATRRVLGRGLSLLGIPRPERM